MPNWSGPARFASSRKLLRESRLRCARQKLGDRDRESYAPYCCKVPRETTFSNLHESEYVKRVSALLGDAYDNLGVIDARAGRYGNANTEFGEAAHWNSGIQDLDRKWGMAAFRANHYDQAIAPPGATASAHPRRSGFEGNPGSLLFHGRQIHAGCRCFHTSSG